MSRHLNDWLKSYLTLQENTEPARLFDKWTGYAVISAALRRKTWLQLGRLRYNTNIYIVFVSEPGVARKTKAIDYGLEFLKDLPDIKTSADSSTREAMLDDLELSGLPEILSSGEEFKHSSLCIVSKEFESFLGQKFDNTRMLTSLTDLFDCPDEWKARTRHGQSPMIVRPWLLLWGATTPDSLSNSLPANAVGGGLTSRILFIWADKKKKSVTIPALTHKELILKDELKKDLFKISRLSGEYTMHPEALRKWDEWYMSYDEDEVIGGRICADKSFSGWYSRKPTYIIKIAILRAASTTDEMIIRWQHIEESIVEIQEVEQQMGNAFKGIGRSEISGDVDTVMEIVKSYSWISEKSLMSLVWRDIDSNKFDNVIDTALRQGKVKREFKGPKGETGIWYRSMKAVPK